MDVQLRLVIVEEALLNVVCSGASRPLFGYDRRGEGLIQALSAHPSPELVQIGTATVDGSAPHDVLVMADGHAVAIELALGMPAPTTVETVVLREGLESRTSPCLGGGTLREKHVSLIGAGSVGSVIGVLLAQAGVGGFGVYDNDTVDATNLARHACDLRDLGRPKAIAVAELLRRRGIQADGHCVDILSLSGDEVAGIARSSNLVVATTDSPAVQFIVNEASIAVSRPALFVGAYERACGGEVFLAQPGGPCLFCAVGFRAALGADLTMKERHQAYQAADVNRLIAEPGLGADIAYLAATAAAYALAALDPTGSRADLLQPNCAFTLLHGGSRPRDTHAQLFASSFEHVGLRVRRESPCPVCGYTTPSDHPE